MNGYGIIAIEDSLDLPIGTKFYFRDNLFEVAEFKGGVWGCPECAFSPSKRNEGGICAVMDCNAHRHDDKFVYFKEVKEIEEQHNNG